MKNEEWQPIESAPKDGTRIIAYGPSVTHATGDWDSRPDAYIAQWETKTLYGDKSGCWVNIDGYHEIYIEALLWMPLPTLPNDLI